MLMNLLESLVQGISNLTARHGLGYWTDDTIRARCNIDGCLNAITSAGGYCFEHKGERDGSFD